MDISKTRVGDDIGSVPGQASSEDSPDRAAAEPVADMAPLTPIPPRSAPFRLPRSLRVGLATDVVQVEVPCCSEPVRLRTENEHFDLEVPAKIRALANQSSPATQLTNFYVQASALKDEQQALALAARLGSALDEAAEATFDAQSDLYKVRVGPVATRQQAEVLKGRLVGLGYASPFVRREQNHGSVSGFEVRFSKDGEPMIVRFAGRTLRIERPSETVLFERSSYRGNLVLFLNDRSTINVVNDVPLEEYLRGVVPKELGPELYPELEALKAQSVAARTYTVKNLGEFLEEGYDICSTPRCQVYGGMAAEHPLSDQAIRETSGEVLAVYVPTGVASSGSRFSRNPSAGTQRAHDQQAVEIVDAMFSASCGGHTENVSSVFPLKAEPYLKSRPCVEAGVIELELSSASLQQVLSRALGGDAGTLAETRLGKSNTQARSQLQEAQLQEALMAIAQAAGLATPRDRLRSVKAGEVRRYLGSAFDLFLDRRWLEGQPIAESTIAKSTVPRRGGQESSHLRSVLARLAQLSEEEAVGAHMRDLLVLTMAQALGVVDFEPLSLHSVDDGVLRAASTETGAIFTLNAGSVLAVSDDGTKRPSSTRIRTYPGHRLESLLVEGRPIAAIYEPSTTSGAPRLAQPWSRFRSKTRLRRLVSERYPGFVLESLSAGTRGSSGRVETLHMTSTDGRSETVTGLAIRWILDVPDTWFQMQPAASGGVAGWRFNGRGRGHGIGMCQVGAFGMAAMGATYRDILEHYYSGVRVLETVPAPIPAKVTSHSAVR